MLRLLPVLALALLSLLASSSADALVNLNTATRDELIALPGIGPAKAQAILDYRTQHGGFKRVEELRDVKGIGAKRYEALRPEITVTSAAPRPAPAKGDAAAKGSIKTTAEPRAK
jgi:competence protein ComEA